MSSKLLMNNNGGSNMQIQKGTVTVTADNQDIIVNGLSFVPNIILVRIISNIPTLACSLCWVYTPYATFSTRTDSNGINAGITGANSYLDKGYNKGTQKIKLIDGGFQVFSIDNSYGPIRQDDQFEWVAIKYE
jgi:hypothetical protein